LPVTVASTLASATGFQLYLDQAVPPSVGAVVNDATVALFLGKSDPATACKALTDAAANP
jgi:raffinose/stachyose/melibiose transport system substrate-binding protein